MMMRTVFIQCGDHMLAIPIGSNVSIMMRKDDSNAHWKLIQPGEVILASCELFIPRDNDKEFQITDPEFLDEIFAIYRNDNMNLSIRIHVVKEKVHLISLQPIQLRTLIQQLSRSELWVDLITDSSVSSLDGSGCMS